MNRAPLKTKPLRRKCAICKTPVITTDLRVKWCSVEHGATYAAQLLERKKQKARTAERRADTERKASLKTRSDWTKEAQQAFNAYRREWCRVNGYVTCPCCDLPLNWNANEVDAGHYRSTGSAPHVRFVENNVWAQRKQCNRYGAGRAVDYRIGLIKRIGLEAVEALEADNTARKWSVDELKAIRDTYRAKLKDLQAGHAPALQAAQTATV